MIEFRTPIRQRESSDFYTPHDTLPLRLETLEIANGTRSLQRKAFSTHARSSDARLVITSPPLATSQVPTGVEGSPGRKRSYPAANTEGCKPPQVIQQAPLSQATAPTIAYQGDASSPRFPLSQVFMVQSPITYCSSPCALSRRQHTSLDCFAESKVETLRSEGLLALLLHIQSLLSFEIKRRDSNR